MKIKRIKMRRNKRPNRRRSSITGKSIEPYEIVQVPKDADGNTVRVQHRNNPSDGITCANTNEAYASGLRFAMSIAEREVSASLPFNSMADRMADAGLI